MRSQLELVSARNSAPTWNTPVSELVAVQEKGTSTPATWPSGITVQESVEGMRSPLSQQAAPSGSTRSVYLPRSRSWSGHATALTPSVWLLSSATSTPRVGYDQSRHATPSSSPV